ncbi:MAG: protein-disulfide reductase DsbD domain-containing protein [Vicinamibacterales bacterium]
MRLATARRACPAAVMAVTLIAGGSRLAAQVTPAPSGPSFLLAAPPTRATISGRYLDATPATSVEAAVPGKAFTLRLDVAPKAGIHVYAPGNKNYTAVRLTVDAPAGVTMTAPTYPKGTEYFFAPLKERVQVYAGPFRLERQVTVDPGSPLAQATTNPRLTISGKLEYQACDDKVCYLPQELPVTWTVFIRR